MTISHVMVAKVLALTGGALCNDEGVHLVLKAKEIIIIIIIYISIV
jgi:hypothetical protein